MSRVHREFAAIFGLHISKSTQKPPAGFVPMLNSKHGGHHRQVGGVWHTWYPGRGVAPKGEHFTDEEHARMHPRGVAHAEYQGIKERADADLARARALAPRDDKDENRRVRSQAEADYYHVMNPAWDKYQQAIKAAE